MDILKLTRFIQQLNRKNDCIVFGDGTIEILDDQVGNKKFDLGIKSWGKIDALVKYGRYRINYVFKFSKTR